MASALVLRTLRLNSIVEAYSALWEELYDEDWRNEEWGADWGSIGRLGQIDSQWNPSTPLRGSHERRAALVEIDALVSVWLGIGVDELIAVLRSRYPILMDREDKMWFDASGRRIAADSAVFGVDQTAEHYEELMRYLDEPRGNPVPEGYAAPFYKADRENEYRQAHAVFSKRLQDAIDAGWPPS